MITDYRVMAGDKVRVEAFRRGIEAAVKPGDVVVDIGCGLGTYAIFACRAGARKVYAIERNDVIIAAREIAKTSGCADRIEFIHGDALSVELPEKADVAITEDFTVVFVDPDTERLVSSIRRRLLRKVGRFVPGSAVICAAPITCRKVYDKLDRLSASEDKVYGVDFSVTREMAMNSIARAWFRPSQLMGAPRRVHRVEFAAGTPFEFDTTLRFRASKTALVHGVAVWFDALLAPRVRLSNAPGAPKTLWGQGLLPLTNPVRAKKGAVVTVALAARRSRDRDRLWWQWEVTGGGVRADGTTFRSFPMSVASLEAGSRSYRPGLSRDGEITECALRMLKSRCTILEVARGLRRRFPRSFGSLREALSRAGEVGRKFGNLKL